MKGCPFCKSTRILKQKKKYKCLDCYKSFSTPKETTDKDVPMREDNIKSIEKLMRKATRPGIGCLTRR